MDEKEGGERDRDQFTWEARVLEYSSPNDASEMTLIQGENV